MWQLAVTVAVSVLGLGLECRDRGFVASWLTDPVRRARNWAYLASNFVVLAVLAGVGGWVGRNVPALVHWAAPLAVEAVACFLVAEFLNWFLHWVKHRHDWLWTFHLQHHVETRYDVNLTLHTHGLEVVVSGTIMALGLRLLGFSALPIEIFETAYFVSNVYKHGSWRASLGPLDWIFVSPAFHRVHHAKELDGNFGSVLTIFDVLFGTAVWPDERAYALEPGTRGGEPFGFLAEFKAFLRPRRS